MLDVLIVTPRYPPTFSGGGELSVRLLASHLEIDDRVASVTVVSFDGSGDTTVDDVPVRRLGAVSSFVTEFQNLRVVPKLRGLLSAYDVVHAYNMELHPAIGYLAPKEGVPSVATLNSYHFLRKRATNRSPTSLDRLYEAIGYPTTGRVLRHYAKRIEAFTALSRAVKRIYGNHGFPTERIEVIPNMLDPSFDPPAAAVGDGDACRLLYVGELMESKGVQYLLRALALLGSEYVLDVVGDGAHRDALRRLTGELGLEPRVTFHGAIPHEAVATAYADADIFVHPGVLPEPFGRTILEAMQAGLPVVVSDVGGPPDVLPDRRLVCEPGDPESLASAVRTARERGQTVGAENRDHVYATFAPERVIPRYVDRYESVQPA